MTRTLAIALALGAIGGTVPGAPTCALAQSDTGLFFEAPDVLSPAQPSITVNLWAQFPAADHALSGVKFDALASESGWGDPQVLLRGPAQTPGAVTGPGVLGAVTLQLHFPDAMIRADPSNPIEIWQATFAITDFSPRTIRFSTMTSEFAVYPLSDEPLVELRPSHEAFHEIRVIPAPGALGLGGLVGAGALRRRRRTCAG
ncbi:MAG: hypothetical protein ACF8R7_04790 [Phycisphaerales bacterium JB039]